MSYGARPYGNRTYGDSTASTITTAPIPPPNWVANLRTPYRRRNAIPGYCRRWGKRWDAFMPNLTASGSILAGGLLSGTASIDVAPPIPGGGPSPVPGTSPVPGRISGGASTWTASTYAVLVCDKYGTRYAELENAVVESVVWELNSWGSARFHFPTSDVKGASIADLILKREVQIWRNGVLLFWGVPVRATAAPDKTTVYCNGLLWHFSRRYFGPLHFNYALDGDMQLSGTGAWTDGSRTVVGEPGVPAAGAVGTTATKDTSIVLQGRQSLKLVSTGQADNYVFQRFLAPSHPDLSITYFASGWIYIPGIYGAEFTDAQTTAGSATVTSASGFAGASLIKGYFLLLNGANNEPANAITGGVIKTVNSSTSVTLDTQFSVTTSGAGLSGRVAQWGGAGPIDASTGLAEFRGLYMQDNTSIHSAGVIVGGLDTFGGGNVIFMQAGGFASPVNQWTRLNAGTPETNSTLGGGITVPAGSVHELELRLYSPPGTAYWADVKWFVQESLSTPPGGQDIGTLLSTVMTYIQDTSGAVVAPKSHLNIAPPGIQVGQQTVRSYQSLDNANVFDALTEYAHSDVCDFAVTWNLAATSRKFAIYPGRHGSVKPQYSVELDRNLSAGGTFQWEIDGENTSTVVRVLGKSQGTGDGVNQEVVDTQDTSLFQGLTLESVETASTESLPADLLAKAKTDLNRLKLLVVTPNLPVPADDFLGTAIGGTAGGTGVVVGDAIPVVINFGFLQSNAIHRIQSMELKPEPGQGNDMLVLTTAPDPWFFSDGVTTASSTTFTSASANFQAGWAGMKCTIVGAGTGGAAFFTHVASVTNATTVVLADAPPVSSTGATFFLGAYISLSTGDGQIAGGSNVLTSLSGNFQSSDVGKTIVVGGAGPLTVSATNQDLVTTIASVVSSSEVTLNSVAGVTVVGATVTVNR